MMSGRFWRFHPSILPPAPFVEPRALVSLALDDRGTRLANRVLLQISGRIVGIDAPIRPLP